jgi:hypothetical protein
MNLVNLVSDLVRGSYEVATSYTTSYEIKKGTSAPFNLVRSLGICTRLGLLLISQPNLVLVNRLGRESFMSFQPRTDHFYRYEVSSVVAL